MIRFSVCHSYILLFLSQQFVCILPVELFKSVYLQNGAVFLPSCDQQCTCQDGQVMCDDFSCSVLATCEDDPDTNNKQCVCTEGYEMDGFDCVFSGL